ncbi:MAG TPA: GntG family PLP-dependent aldolase [Acidimicrobiia bacterium]|nr:GntG family PLP-dependent aldolase [Acidimicrobiia bacterium]
MIDLFSDTHTLPTDGMRAAIAAADVGDEQLGEDPTTAALEERVAGLLGKPAALFMPSGSMCNKVAVSALTRPGDAVVCDHRAHVFRFEGGGSAVLSGTVYEPLVTENGHFTVEQLESVMNPGSVYQPRTSLVALEQTHNFAGGTVWPLAQYDAVCAAARVHDASVYTDGARLLNAVAASGVPAARWAEPVDAIWLDFSKGLGAPAGAAIAGSEGFIEAARRFKYLYGGAMRQSGILTAAAIYALDHHVDRLADDNAHAARLGEGMRNLGLDVLPVETNMVFAAPPAGMTTDTFVKGLATEGVRVSTISPTRVRMVTHLGVSGDDIDSAISAVSKVASSE